MTLGECNFIFEFDPRDDAFDYDRYAQGLEFQYFDEATHRTRSATPFGSPFALAAPTSPPPTPRKPRVKFARANTMFRYGEDDGSVSLSKTPTKQPAFFFREDSVESDIGDLDGEIQARRQKAVVRISNARKEYMKEKEVALTSSCPAFPPFEMWMALTVPGDSRISDVDRDESVKDYVRCFSNVRKSLF